MSTEIKLKNCRFSYAHLWEPRAAPGSTDKKFSVSLIIPKDHPQIGDIKAAIAKEIDEKWPDPKKRPAKLNNPLRDGDAERPNDAAYEGSYFINASCFDKYPPLVYDGQQQKVLDNSFWTSGDYGHCLFDLYPFEKPQNRGIGVGLKQVMFLRKGEPLGYSNSKPAFDVEEVDTGSVFD